MSKFIELTVDGEKHLFNADTIFEIEPMKSGCRVYQTVYAPGSIDFTNVVVGESYEQIEALITGDIDTSLEVTAEELCGAVIDEQRKCDCGSWCSECKWHNDKVSCVYAIAANYINKRLKGEIK